jgi:hypothetical protein
MNEMLDHFVLVGAAVRVHGAGWAPVPALAQPPGWGGAYEPSYAVQG